MSGLWSLICFEYKKILKKRSVRITLLAAVLISIISVPGTLFGSTYIDGKPYESNYDAMLKDRNYARAFNGKKINSELILKAVKGYSKISESDKYQEKGDYQQFARPYSAIYGIIRTVFNMESRRFNMEDFQQLTSKEAEQFYNIRREKLVQIVETTVMSKKSKEQVLELDTRINIPLTFSYTDGYTRFFVILYSIGLTAALAMAICIAPLFSGEYTSGTDQLILSSRYGKNKLIKAKLLTGFSLSALICLILIFLAYLLSMLIFGADGRGAPLQLYVILSPYPITIGQAAGFLALCTLFSCLMTAALTMLLSAKLKTPFGVIILISLLLIVPMFINVPETSIILYKLSSLLPINMMAFGTVLDGIQFELFGLIIKPYVFMPLFALVISSLVVPFTFHSFKNHQIE